ncbi:histone deacetylase [Streptomyces sp. NPDC090052]|uniref:histone deacetylase n=1 Tax=unclassified Streptomyces TaxID=2593676 RepID=UPI0022552C3A|nr:histone deacetylase [Streptomyces sp. NBC_01306]MCX4723442.1 histone deacetylase [Streptomyces sp. NBC_01306]WSX45067.1 histone deacetylase [Streptomyces sp. NBC_00963]
MTTAHPIEPGRTDDRSPSRVWYASYGSNMHLDRLSYYIKGGRLPGTGAEYPGCRDRSLPGRSVPVELPGTLYFATRSPVWGGGRAFYDPQGEGRVLGRAHLVSASQFSDIAAQEMGKEPAKDLDLAQVLACGVARLGNGRYETLIHPGQVDGLPVLTFTAPWGSGDLPVTEPSPAYVRYIASGLLEAGAWDAGTVAAYVASAPGAAGHWTEQAVRELMGQ